MVVSSVGAGLRAWSVFPCIVPKDRSSELEGCGAPPPDVQKRKLRLWYCRGGRLRSDWPRRLWWVRYRYHPASHFMCVVV